MTTLATGGEKPRLAKASSKFTPIQQVPEHRLPTKASLPFSASKSPGFTLIEIIVALTIVIIMVALTIPEMRGFHDEKRAREPIRQLEELVADLRQRAMQENRAYQLSFEPGKITGTRFSVELTSKEALVEYFKKLEEERQKRIIERQKIEITQVAASDGEVLEGAGATPAPPPPPEIFTKTVPLPEGFRYEVLFWADEIWDPIENDSFRRWVFQPSGLCDPVQIRSQRGEVRFEVHFGPLTGEVEKEYSHVPPSR